MAEDNAIQKMRLVSTILEQLRTADVPLAFQAIRDDHEAEVQKLKNKYERAKRRICALSETAARYKRRLKRHSETDANNDEDSDDGSYAPGDDWPLQAAFGQAYKRSVAAERIARRHRK